MKRVIQKKGKTEFAAKFTSAGGKRKASALGEMDLLSELDYERILYFHDAFEKKSVVVLITELYPFSFLSSVMGNVGGKHVLLVEKALPFLQHCLKFVFASLPNKSALKCNLKDTKDPKH